ncbi:hypothetical protein [Lutibacter sp.]|uniref:glycoside hydrolase family 78 protein n=1 Tax=Lutibacter sp. TaxID=1925666 RepID=UPI0034A0588D
MKKILYLVIVLGVSLSSCGGSGGDDGPTPEPVNTKPSNPLNSKPINNLLCIDNSVMFEWSASTDAEGDAIKYQLQIATDNQFLENVETRDNLSATSVQISLERGIAYYWRVKAIDSKNASSDYSSSFQFYTEGDGKSNYVPFLPSIVAPTLNEIVQTNSVKLEWTASDTDGDLLLFDVYFGTNNPPTSKAAENISEPNVTVDLATSTNYYWKVVVKDDKGGSAIGQIWNFKSD